MIAFGLLCVAFAIITAGLTINVGLDNVADAIRRRRTPTGASNG